MKAEAKWHDIAYSSWAVEFVILAREYCTKWDEEIIPAPNPLVSFRDWLFEFLGLLYYKATRLPKLLHVPDFESLGTSLSEMQYHRISTHAAECIGEAENELELALTDDEARLFQGTPLLSEIVADLYQELYELLVHFRDGELERMVQALARCQYNFLTEWGAKVLLSLRWLHMLRAEHFLAEND